MFKRLSQRPKARIARRRTVNEERSSKEVNLIKSEVSLSVQYSDSGYASPCAWNRICLQLDNLHKLLRNYSSRSPKERWQRVFGERMVVIGAYVTV